MMILMLKKSLKFLSNRTLEYLEFAPEKLLIQSGQTSLKDPLAGPPVTMPQKPTRLAIDAAC